jgi:serine/threonine protein kinase
LGNVFYTLLTKESPFDDETDKVAQRKVKNGERPPIPEEYLRSTDPFVQVFIKIIKMCWIQDPKQRASARDVQKFITSELKRLGVHES